MKDNTTGVGKGCAFVKMGQKEQALFAINNLNGKHTWEGCPRPMEVRFAESRAQRQQMSKLYIHYIYTLYISVCIIYV